MFIRRSLVAAVAGVLAIAGIHTSQPMTARAAGVPAFDHVFVIVLENTSYSAIVGSASAPYINSLLPSGALATNYTAVTHPSLPNYLALAGGSTYGITSDCTTCWISATNIGDTLESAGRSWKTYQESMPSACFVGDSYPYAQKHNPFIYFNDIRNNSSRCQNHVVPYSQLSTDLTSTSTTPSFAFITPNMCNDMHDCSTGTGDAWLQQQVPTILGSPAFATQRSLLAITWDEDDFSGSNQVATIFLGSSTGPGSTSATAYNHYSLLHTFEAALGLPSLTANDAGAATMQDMFGSVPLTPCTSVSATVNPTPPQPPGTAVQITASAAGCPNPLFEVWISPPSGGWQVAVPYGTNNIFTWNNSGLAAGTYRFSLWARDASSPGTNGTAPNRYDAFSAFPYDLGSGTGPCSGMTASPAPLSPTTVGGQVNVTAAASGCSSALYEFWLQSNSGAWSLAQPYSTSSTFAWNTVGRPAGSYRFSVWARDAGSSGTAGTAPYTYDSFSAFPYTLTTTACSAMSAPASPASTANVGTKVTISASATGCPNPLYAVYLLPPGGSWSLVQPYSTSATFTWNTGGRAAGSYRFSVWARDASSSTAYDAFDAYQYLLAAVPCTGMTAFVSPAGSAAAGTTVTVTATASGCPNPQYEVWVLPPGGTWTLALGYGSSATFTWSTADKAAGSYRFSVWVRDASSGGTNGTAPYTYDAFSAFQYALS